MPEAPGLRILLRRQPPRPKARRAARSAQPQVSVPVLAAAVTLLGRILLLGLYALLVASLHAVGVCGRGWKARSGEGMGGAGRRRGSDCLQLGLPSAGPFPHDCPATSCHPLVLDPLDSGLVRDSGRERLNGAVYEALHLGQGVL
jgi:hypothetical protein